MVPTGAPNGVPNGASNGASNGVSQADYEKLYYTADDAKDMQRMGQFPQLRRTFRQISTISLITVLVAAWEYLFLANTQGLIDGGLAGLFWSYIWSLVGFGLIAASLAEMASIAPTDGGMYHWVSEFAPPKYEHFLSYMTGWMSTLAWQAGNASGGFVAGLMIQAIVILNDSSYETTAWRSTLFVFAAIFIVWICNTLFIRVLPMLQNCIMILHILSFFAITILLWVGAPLNSASDVFLTFTNGGGWRSVGVSVMIGQITSIYAMVGFDAAAHMAEETRNAGLVVPQAMMWSFTISSIMGLIFLITMLFTITSIDDALADPSGYPAVWILRQALPHSNAGVTAIVAYLFVLVNASNVSFTVATSRQTFAFARDHGLPFSAWISHVSPRLLIPFNSVTLTCVIALLMACINIGSSIAFNAIISLFLVALMATYAVSISCVLYRKYASLMGTDLALPDALWLMPLKTGMVVNFLAILYSLFAFFWCFWPNSTSTALADLNWAPVIFGGVMLLAPIAYLVNGRRTYVSPVSKVTHRGV